MKGQKWIFWHKRLEKWQVQIRFGGRAFHVGYFAELSEAVKARDEVIEKIQALGGESSLKKATALDNLFEMLKLQEETPEAGSFYDEEPRLGEIVGDEDE